MMGNGDGKQRLPGTALALSGGGFRATLFHIGSLQRLNELGKLKDLKEITSVSGGSITAGWLGFRWKELSFDANNVATNFAEIIATPLRTFCSQTIDVGSIVGGIISPFRHPSQKLTSKYDKHLFHGATLQDLPKSGEGPRFTIYATSLQTGVSVRMSQPYMADYRVGMLKKPTISLAQAVAASSAFPPPLCPVTIKLNPDAWENVEGADLYSLKKIRKVLRLGDGGIYDNMGLERIWNKYETVLVSDAGAPFGVDDSPFLLRISQLARTKRALDIITEQTRALRKRKLMEMYKEGEAKGTYWGIGTSIQNYDLIENGRQPPMVTDNEITKSLATMRTRLNKFSPQEQGRLINWGYAITDAAMRRYVLDGDVAIGTWPVPEQPIK